MKWRKGKIIELITGNDGKVKGVKLNVYKNKTKENCCYKSTPSVNRTNRN